MANLLSRVNGSLTGRFMTWFLLIGVLPTLAIGLFSSSRASDALLERAKLRIDGVAAQREDALSEKFNGELREMQAIGSNELFQTCANLPAIQQTIGRVLKTAVHFQDLLLLDRSGRIVAANSPGEIGTDKSSDAIFTEPKRTNAPSFKDVYVLPTTQQVGYAISLALPCGGVLVGRVKVDELNSALGTIDGLGTSGEAYL